MNEAVSFGDKYTEFLDIGGRNVGLRPDTGEILKGKQFCIQHISLTLCTSGQGWIYDTWSSFP